MLDKAEKVRLKLEEDMEAESELEKFLKEQEREDLHLWRGGNDFFPYFINCDIIEQI